MKLFIEIGGGQLIPRYYGVAYRRSGYDSSVCALIPLNVLCWIGFRIHEFFKNPYLGCR